MDVQYINGKRQYVMFDDFDLHHQILYWKNVINFPNDFVNFIEKLDLNELSYEIIPKWTEWIASNNNSVKYGYVKNIFIDPRKKILGTNDVEKKSLYIINTLLMAQEICFERYIKRQGLNINDYYIDSGILQVKKYNSGQYMGPHCDNYDGHSNLAFSMVTYLNDDYKGGEISFPNHNITLKPEAGSSIMFPATDPFVHQVFTIESGIRYVMTTSIYKRT